MSMKLEILGFLTAGAKRKISCICFHQLEKDAPGKSSRCPCQRPQTADRRFGVRRLLLYDGHPGQVVGSHSPGR